MKKAEIQIGATYVAKVSGKLANVRIIRESQYGGWDAINQATKHAVRIRGAARLRRKVDTDRLAAIRSLRQGGATFEDARNQVDREEQAIRDAATDAGYDSQPGAAEDARMSEKHARMRMVYTGVA